MTNKFHFLFLVIIGLFLTVGCSNPETTEKPPQQAELSAKETASKKGPKRVILFFGNSLTAGYGIDTRERFTSLLHPGKVQLQRDDYVILF